MTKLTNEQYGDIQLHVGAVEDCLKQVEQSTSELGGDVDQMVRDTEALSDAVNTLQQRLENINGT